MHLYVSIVASIIHALEFPVTGHTNAAERKYIPTKDEPKYMHSFFPFTTLFHAMSNEFSQIRLTTDTK